MLIIKNTGSVKNLKINGINRVIVNGINKLKDSTVLKQLVSEHPDLSILDKIPEETKKSIEPIVETGNTDSETKVIEEIISEESSDNDKPRKKHKKKNKNQDE